MWSCWFLPKQRKRTAGVRFDGNSTSSDSHPGWNRRSQPGAGGMQPHSCHQTLHRLDQQQMSLCCASVRFLREFPRGEPFFGLGSLPKTLVLHMLQILLSISGALLPLSRKFEYLCRHGTWNVRISQTTSSRRQVFHHHRKGFSLLPWVFEPFHFH